MAVGLITAAGTLGGAMFNEFASQKREKRADQQRIRERDDRAQQARRDLYARLNATARAYRVAARDAVRATERGEDVESAVLEAAKEAWAEEYSQAQMALSKDVLEVTSALNRALGVGYAVVKQLPSSLSPDAAYSRANAWFSGPLSDGVYLLRVTLRHDLGVEVQPDFERSRMRALAALDIERRALERQLDAEQAQTSRSP
ncbi:hypothetical protein VM636_09645 [Streptomyces sp. SCSIO 75703]|uniref:hypothetical protein n=1 Tax=unclassified Streptomyces TaxID=2593676 RepID=UPI001F15F592|nr:MULTISPECIES: hypothetical protein [unclassified Streptomyces]